MEEALVPLYLHHRYQAEATSKVVGGLYYSYALRGDGQEPLRYVPAEEQWAAVEALIKTLDPVQLAIPTSVLEILPPRPFGYPPHQELFQRNTGLVFDAIAPAGAAADMTLAFLLHPERAARLVQQKALQPDLPGLSEVVSQVVESVFGIRYRNGYHIELNRAVERALVDRLMRLAAQAPMGQVRAETTLALKDLRMLILEGAGTPDLAQDAHYHLLAEDIRRFLERPHETVPGPAPLGTPPGSPIGEAPMWWMDWDFNLLDDGSWATYDWWWRE